jgi:hypothetical protein
MATMLRGYLFQLVEIEGLAGGADNNLTGHTSVGWPAGYPEAVAYEKMHTVIGASRNDKNTSNNRKTNDDRVSYNDNNAGDGKSLPTLGLRG